MTNVPPLAARITAWRAGLARAATFLTTAARPPLSRDRVQDLLMEVTDACDQPPLTRW